MDHVALFISCRFRGPNGIEMIVNCLPLYDPLPISAEGDGNNNGGSKKPAADVSSSEVSSASAQNDDQPKDSTPSPRKSFSLIKAKSMEALDVITRELELHDHDTEMKRSHEALAINSVGLPPRSWSRSYGKNVTVVVQSSPQASGGMSISKSHENLAGHPALHSPPTAPVAFEKRTQLVAVDHVRDVQEEENKEEVKSSPTKEEHKTSGEVEGETKAENEPSAKKGDEFEHQNPEPVGGVSKDSPATESSQSSDVADENVSGNEEKSTESSVQESDYKENAESSSSNDTQHSKDTDELPEKEEPIQETSPPENKPKEETKTEQNSKEADEKESENDSSKSVLENETESRSEDSEKPSSSGAISATDSTTSASSNQPPTVTPPTVTPPTVTPPTTTPPTTTPPTTTSPSTSTVQVRTSPKKESSKKRLRTSKSMSPTYEDNGSDEESGGQEFHLNYIDQPTMSTLKRSSGSVSFISRKSVSPVRVLTAETSVEIIVEESPNQSSDDPGPTEKVPIVKEAVAVASQANSSPSAPPPNTSLPNGTPQALSEQASLSSLHYSVSEVLIPSPLPDPPATMEPTYVERSGWLMKLSHRKGMFGDKWQKRYFVLHRSWLYYFKKYGVGCLVVEMS